MTTTAAATERREQYLYLHRTVIEIIPRLDNMLDPSQIDGVLLRLDCIKRYLVNIIDDAQTDSITTQLDQVIGSLQEERNQLENVEAYPFAAKLVKELSRTMAYTTRNTVNRLARKELKSFGTVEPRFNEVAGDRPNLFVKWRVRYIENLDITNLRENDQKVRYIEVIVND